jgi:hypothetical protein
VRNAESRWSMCVVVEPILRLCIDDGIMSVVRMTWFVVVKFLVGEFRLNAGHVSVNSLVLAKTVKAWRVPR